MHYIFDPLLIDPDIIKTDAKDESNKQNSRDKNLSYPQA